MNIILFPDGICFEIFRHLSAADLCKICRVCKRFLQLANNDLLWKLHCIEIKLPGLENLTNLRTEFLKFQYRFNDPRIDWELWNVNKSASLDGDCSLKILIVGDVGVGKFCTSCRFVDGTYDESRTKSLSDFDYKITHHKIHQKHVKLIISTYVYLPFKQTSYNPFRGPHGILVLFDLTNQTSFDNVKCWLNEIDRYAHPEVNIIIVGNKLDLYDQRVVDWQTANEFASSLGHKYFEISSS